MSHRRDRAHECWQAMSDRGVSYCVAGVRAEDRGVGAADTDNTGAHARPVLSLALSLSLSLCVCVCVCVFVCVCVCVCVVRCIYAYLYTCW